MRRLIQQPGVLDDDENSDAEKSYRDHESLGTLSTKRTSIVDNMGEKSTKTRQSKMTFGARAQKFSHESSPSASQTYPSPVRQALSELIVGIDVGTTYSGVAWASTDTFDEQPIRVITDWPSGARRNDALEKVPSRIALAKENDELLENKYGYNVAPLMKQYTWFKLLLDRHVSRTDYDDGYLQDENFEGVLQLPRDMGAEELMAEYLRCLYQHIMSKLERVLSRDALNDRSIQFWFTTPATWSDRANASTRKAAEAAGFGERRDDKISMIAEPEAAATAILTARVEERQTSYTAGQNVLVIDIGGGTTDLSLLRVVKTSPLKMEEAVVGIGGKCGSTTIDRALVNMLQEEIGEPFVKLPQSKTGPGSRFMEEFELIKKDFDGAELEKKFNLPLTALSDPLRLSDPDTQRYDFVDCEIIITGHEIARMFDIVVQNAIRLADQKISALRAEQKGDLKSIILCGGMESSKYVWKIFDRYCKGNYNGTISLHTDERAWSAVARGAVTRGLEGSLILSKYSRRWYGFMVHRKYQPGDNKKQTFMCALKGRRTLGFFECHVKKGERFTGSMFKQIKVYVPIDESSDDAVGYWWLYSSERNTMPRRVDDDGVVEVGRIRVDFTDFVCNTRKKLRSGDHSKTTQPAKFYVNLNLKMGSARGTLEVKAMHRKKEVGFTTIEYGSSH